MNIIETLNMMLPELTKNERKLAENLINNPIDLIRYSSADSLAKNSGCSRASLIRLTQKLGFSGFAEFKSAFSKEMAENISPNTQSVLDYYANTITLLNNVYNTQGFKTAIEILREAREVYTQGSYHSNYSAKQFAFRLNRNNRSAHAIDEACTPSNTPGLHYPGSVLVIFSISGGKFTDDFLKPLEDLKKGSCCKVILITMDDNTPYSKYADATIILPCVSRMCKTSILDDAAVFYLAIEMIIEKLAIHKETN